MGNCKKCNRPLDSFVSKEGLCRVCHILAHPTYACTEVGAVYCPKCDEFLGTYLIFGWKVFEPYTCSCGFKFRLKALQMEFEEVK